VVDGSVADLDLRSGAFLILRSGMEKITDPRTEINIPGHFSESIVTILWVKNT
jgi:hypothetical protein